MTDIEQLVVCLAPMIHDVYQLLPCIWCACQGMHAADSNRLVQCTGALLCDLLVVCTRPSIHAITAGSAADLCKIGADSLAPEACRQVQGHQGPRRKAGCHGSWPGKCFGAAPHAGAAFGQVQCVQESNCSVHRMQRHQQMRGQYLVDHRAQQEACVPGNMPPADKSQQDVQPSAPGEVAPSGGPDAELRRQIVAHHARIQVHAHMCIHVRAKSCALTEVICEILSSQRLAPWPTQGVEQQLRAVIAHEDAYHFEAQLDKLSKGRQKHADMLADMAEACAAGLSEVCAL